MTVEPVNYTMNLLKQNMDRLKIWLESPDSVTGHDHIVTSPHELYVFASHFFKEK